MNTKRALLLLAASLPALLSSSPPTIDRFQDDRLTWSNGVPQHNFEASTGAITITPTPNLDYWSKTFYEPLLVKHDAETLLTHVAADAEATLTTAFTLKPRAQFDQAGIMILVDESTWVKAGIGTRAHPPSYTDVLAPPSQPTSLPAPRKRVTIVPIAI